MAPSPIANFGGVSPRDFSFNSTSRQLCVDSRTPSSIARKCFSPRSFTPITTRALASSALLSVRCRHRLPRPASDAMPCRPTSLLHPEPPALSGLHPSLHWKSSSGRATAVPLPVTSSCVHTAAPELIGTSPARRSSRELWDLDRDRPQSCLQFTSGQVTITHHTHLAILCPSLDVLRQQLGLHRLVDQLLCTASRQLCQRIDNRISTCQLNNVILTHGGVSPTVVVLMFRNNKSTRYPAFFQFLSNNTFSYNSNS